MPLPQKILLTSLIVTAVATFITFLFPDATDLPYWFVLAIVGTVFVGVVSVVISAMCLVWN
jgi:uncharacterized protein (DUF983 family)